MSTLAGRLNLDLAWRKAVECLDDTCFVTHPYEVPFVEMNLKDWIKNLRDEIRQGYRPGLANVIDCPKSDWHLRPGAVLSMRDHVVYNALIIDMLGKIKRQTQWSIDKRVRFSNVLMRNQRGNRWFEYGVKWWIGFEEQSVALTKKGNNFVMISDISAYFENVDIGRLISDLAAIGISKDARDLLSSCLNRWANSRARGLPQGYVPSNILSEVYLDLIDRQMAREGFSHLRYSDDVRVFCKTEREAIEALHSITRLLRDKGLNLQTAKSKIVKRKQAIEEFQYVNGIIGKAVKACAKELKNDLILEYPYCAPSEIRALMASKKHEIPLKSITGVFDQHFVQKESRFNKRLFHFVLNRLGAAGNPRAVDYCLKGLLIIPEETRDILRYFSNLPHMKNRIANRIVTIIAKDLIIPEYQIYQILEWLYDQRIYTKRVLNQVRQVVRNPGIPTYMLDYCIAYLGDYGDSTDIEQLSHLYRNSNDPLSKATVIYGIRRMEKGRRNAIYSRAKSDDFLVEMAVKKAVSSTP